MSHRLVLVILPIDADSKDIHYYVDELLDPFCEHNELAPYKNECECVGKSEVVRSMMVFGDAEDEEDEGITITPVRPITSIKGLKKIADRNCSFCDGKGWYELTFNYKAQWDFKSIGGRFYGWIHAGRDYNVETLIEDNSCRVRDISRKCGYPPAVVLTPEGEWIDQGKKIEREWAKEVRQIYKRYPDHLAVAVDVHS